MERKLQLIGLLKNPTREQIRRNDKSTLWKGFFIILFFVNLLIILYIWYGKLRKNLLYYLL